MHSNRINVRADLHRLASQHPKLNLLEAEQRLAGLWGAKSVEIKNAEGKTRRLLLANALDQTVHVRIVFESVEEYDVPAVDDRTGMSTAEPAPLANNPSQDNYDSLKAKVVREVISQEKHRGLCLLKFMAQSYLPSLGLTSAEAHRLLEGMITEGILARRRLPNPKSAQHPTSVVSLNGDHPLVVRVLGAVPAPRRFEPIGRIRGELLSETIIRERE